MNIPIYTKQICADLYLVDTFGRPLLSRITEKLISITLKHMDMYGYNDNKLIKDYGYSFVLVGLHEKIIKDFVLDETLTIRTWVVGSNSPFMSRYFSITNEQGEVVLEASMLSVLMDVEKRKMVTSNLMGLNELDTENPPEISISDARIEKITRPEDKDPDYVRHFKVSYSDLDINNHLNSARYVAYVESTLGYDWFLNNRIEEIEIRFQKEVRFGERIAYEAFLYDKKVIFVGEDKFSALIKC